MGDGPGRGKRSPLTLALMGLLAFQGLSGIVGGLALILDPTGASIELPLEWLSGSPFPDYRVPGLVLFSVLGVGPLAVTHLVWTGRGRGGLGALLVGAALLVWIGVEVAVVGYHASPPLQLVYGIVGALIVVLALGFRRAEHRGDRDR